MESLYLRYFGTSSYLMFGLFGVRAVRTVWGVRSVRCSNCSEKITCSHCSLFGIFLNFGVRCSHCSVRTLRTPEQRTVTVRSSVDTAHRFIRLYQQHKLRILRSTIEILGVEILNQQQGQHWTVPFCLVMLNFSAY